MKYRLTEAQFVEQFAKGLEAFVMQQSPYGQTCYRDHIGMLRAIWYPAGMGFVYVDHLPEQVCGAPCPGQESYAKFYAVEAEREQLTAQLEARGVDAAKLLNDPATRAALR